MNIVNRLLRFVIVLVLSAMILSLLARLMLAADFKWAGAAVWGASPALALADMYFRWIDRKRD